jgi:hypothetical protein
MKTLILIAISFLFLSYSFGQSKELYQPDSVYKINSVKSRIISFDSSSTKAALIYNYDKNGRLIDYGLTDNETGKAYQFKTVYNYDSTGKIKTDIEVVDDSSYNKHSKYYYNAMGQKISKYTFDNFGNLIQRDTILYNPITEIETFIDRDTITRQQTAVYEDGNQFAYTRFFGYEYRDGKKSSWNYHFKNYFDKQNRIIRRDDSLWKPLKIIDFSYYPSGLLLKKTERFERPNSQTNQLEYIRYEYW